MMSDAFLFPLTTEVLMSSSVELRDQLARQDPEFGALVEQHRAHESKLAELAAKGWLTAEEEQEVKRLKKEKLHLKDRMEARLRSHRVT